AGGELPPDRSQGGGVRHRHDVRVRVPLVQARRSPLRERGRRPVRGVRARHRAPGSARPGCEARVTRERRLGLELAGNLSIAEKVEIARWAEAHGYHDAWVAEISDPDVFVTLGLIAQAT